MVKNESTPTTQRTQNDTVEPSEVRVLGTLVVKLKNGTERTLTLRSRRCRGVPVLEARDDVAATVGAGNDLWTVFELEDFPVGVRLHHQR